MYRLWHSQSPGGNRYAALKAKENKEKASKKQKEHCLEEYNKASSRLKGSLPLDFKTPQRVEVLQEILNLNERAKKNAEFTKWKQTAEEYTTQVKIWQKLVNSAKKLAKEKELHSQKSPMFAHAESDSESESGGGGKS